MIAVPRPLQEVQSTLHERLEARYGSTEKPLEYFNAYNSVMADLPLRFRRHGPYLCFADLFQKSGDTNLEERVSRDILEDVLRAVSPLTPQHERHETVRDWIRSFGKFGAENIGRCNLIGEALQDLKIMARFFQKLAKVEKDLDINTEQQSIVDSDASEVSSDG